MRKGIAVLLVLAVLAGCCCALSEADIWACPSCGAENSTNFCTKCGTEKPKGIVCPGCGMNYPTDTDVIFCGECGTKLLQAAEVSFGLEGDGFATAEEAALTYLAGLKNLDLSQTLSAYAWETLVDHYDFKAFISRTGIVSPASLPGMPVSNDLLRSANIQYIRDSEINYICRAIEYYINNEMLLSGTGTVVFKEDNAFDEYMTRCDNGRIEKLATMENIRVYAPDDVTAGRFSNEKVQKNILRQNAVYGAEETKSVFVAVDIGAEKYAIAPTVARYGDKWYVVSSNSMITSILGIETNRMAFFELPDELKEQVISVTPIMSIDELPENNTTTVRYEGDGFKSPEEAVYCYYYGLKDGNVQQMMQAFAWETQDSHYSLRDYAAWMLSINYNAPIRMSIDNKLMTEMNVNSLRYNQSRKIYSSLRQYILKDDDRYEDLLTGHTIVLKDEEIETFVQAFKNGKAENLKTLHNIRMLDPANIIIRYNSESVGKRQKALQKIYGADELKEVIATADVNGETLIFNPIMARYGDKWFINSLDGTAFSLLGIDSTKTAFFSVNGSAELALSLIQ